MFIILTMIQFFTVSVEPPALPVEKQKVTKVSPFFSRSSHSTTFQVEAEVHSDAEGQLQPRPQPSTSQKPDQAEERLDSGEELLQDFLS